MNHLLMTTSFVLFAALPVFAASQTQTSSSQSQQTQTEQANAPEEGQQQSGSDLSLGDTVLASQLIGTRLYMPAQDQAGIQGGTTTQNPSGNASQSQTDMTTVPQGDAQNQNNEPNTAQPGATRNLRIDPATSAAGANKGAGIAPHRGNLQMIGEVRDLILNIDGDAEGLVIDPGGYLGISANSLRISIEDVRFVPKVEAQSAQERTEPAVDIAEKIEFSIIYTGDRAAFEKADAFD